MYLFNGVGGGRDVGDGGVGGGGDVGWVQGLSWKIISGGRVTHAHPLCPSENCLLEPAPT